MTELICTVCPRGCHLIVDEKNGASVTGNGCSRGVRYGHDEVTDPRRILTGTVEISGSVFKRCPVKTSLPVPKAMIMQVMSTLNGVKINAPVSTGDVVVHNVCGIGADWIVTGDMPRL